MPFIENDGQYSLDLSERKETMLTVTLQSTGARETKTNLRPIVFSDCGIRVDSVVFTSTEMAVYYLIEYTVIDKAAYALTDGGLCFEFLDENGVIIPDGIPTGSPGGRTSIAGSLAAMESLPGEIIIRGYNCLVSDGDSKLRYESHVIELN